MNAFNVFLTLQTTLLYNVMKYLHCFSHRSNTPRHDNSFFPKQRNSSFFLHRVSHGKVVFLSLQEAQGFPGQCGFNQCGIRFSAVYKQHKTALNFDLVRFFYQKFPKNFFFQIFSNFEARKQYLTHLIVKNFTKSDQIFLRCNKYQCF